MAASQQLEAETPAPQPPPGVQVNLTKTHSLDQVRREERIPEDSPDWQAGNRIENRVRGPPAELPGDVFDRQRVIVGFDQAQVERQRCLVLGAGGVGQNVALQLARLGVAELTLLDKDVVEASNLTRQCLVSLRDVGRSKAEAAAENIQAYHNLRSVVRWVHSDALADWSTVVRLARNADVIFNCIDVGPSWDYAVNSLAKEFRLPLLQGQSYAWFCNAEFYSGQPDRVCAACASGLQSAFHMSPRDMAHKFGLLAALVQWRQILSEDPPAQPEEEASGDGSSSPAPPPPPHHAPLDAAALAAFFEQEPRFRVSGPSLLSIFQSILDEDLGHASHLSLSCLPEHEGRAETLAQFMRAYYLRVEALLDPGRISGLPDLLFLPRARPLPTRYFGSWVAPCMMVAALMVSQFTNSLTGPSQQNPPINISFQLDLGVTDTESLAYETGMSLTPEDRPKADSGSDAQCRVCLAAKRLHHQPEE